METKFNLSLTNVQRTALKWGSFTLFLLLSFFAPLILSFVLLRNRGFYPFDENGYTIIRRDFQSQYISYLRYYRTLLIEHGSFIYTTSKFFGGDFLSLFTYYLASPFNLFLPLIGESDIPYFILVSNILKRSFASLFFYLLCHFRFGKDSLLFSGLAIGYGRISYFFVYASNFRWLDTLALLPLVVLGYEFLKDCKHLWLYPLAVCFTRLVGWYLGCLVCLFLLLLFISDFVIRGDKKHYALPFLYRFVLLSLFGGLLAGILWIPAFLHFSGTKASRKMPDFTLANPFSFLQGFLENGYTTSEVIQQNFGYRTRFVGMVPLVLGQLYFFSQGYPLKKRLSSAVLFFVYALGSLTSVTNALLHGGREPTWFPCRFSFLMGFLVCYFASSFVASKEKTHLYGYALPLIPLTLVCLIVSKGKDSFGFPISLSLPSLLIYLFTLFFCFGYERVRYFKPKFSFIAYPLLSLFLTPLCRVSSYNGGKSVISTNIEHNQYKTQDLYLEDRAYQSDVDKVKEYAADDGPYRRERTFNRPGNYNEIDNNPMFYGYSGLAHFSSTAKKNVENFLPKLGFQYNGYSERHDGGSTLAMTSLLGLKYWIDEPSSSDTNLALYPSNTSNGIRKKLNLEGHDSTISFYENTKALPLGYPIGHTNETYVAEGRYNEDGSVYYFDAFEYQNQIYKEFVPGLVDNQGKEKEIFHSLELQKIGGAATISSLMQDGYYRLSGKKGDTLSFSFLVPEEAYGKNLYRGVKNNFSGIDFFLDGKYREINTYWHQGIRGFKDNRYHRHTLSLTLKQDFDEAKFRPEVYYEDDEVLGEYLDCLLSSHTELKEVKGFFSYGYEGTFEKKGQQDFLFTLPREKGISLYVDGKKREAVTRFSIFSAIDLTSIEDGRHTIKILYTDNGYKIGFVVTILSFLSLGAVLLLAPKFRYPDGINPKSFLTRRKHGKRKVEK